MIRLFGTTDTTFETNGDLVISPLKARVHKEDNGEFYLDLETDISYIDYLTANRIIVAPTPQGDQAFRIAGAIEKTGKKIRLKAKHVFYDGENFVIADSYVDNKSCNYAINHLNDATDRTSPFTVSSNVSVVNSFRCVRKNLVEAIKTVLERWGGHLVRNNFNISIQNTIGEDNGVNIQYKKNLKDITCEENWTNVVTKILPVGKDGQLLDDLYLVSQIQYDMIYAKTISFSQDIDRDDYLSDQDYINALKTDLEAQARAYLQIHQYPEVNYTLKANLEKVTDVGDIIKVFDERLNLEILTNVISYDYDCIQEKYVELEFGNFKQDIKNLVSNINQSTDEKINEAKSEFSSALNTALENATETMWSAMSESHVIYDGDKIMIVDALPKEDATNVILINSQGIAFSNTGINGTFVTAWTIDGTFNAQNINVINFVADLIRGGTLKLGNAQNEYGALEVYNASNNLIATLNKDGFYLNNSNSGTYNYTYLDVYLALRNIKGEITLPNTLKSIYDLDNDNTVTVLDVVRMLNIINGTQTSNKTVAMSVKIDVEQPDKVINIRNADDLQTIIGLFQIYSYIMKTVYLHIGSGYATNVNEGTYGITLDGINKKLTITDTNQQVTTTIDSGKIDAYNVYASSGGSKGYCMHGEGTGHTYRCNWEVRGTGNSYSTVFEIYVDGTRMPIIKSSDTVGNMISEMNLRTSYVEFIAPGYGSYGIPNIFQSDTKLKENVEDSEVNAIDFIMNIRHIQFDWKDTPLALGKGHENIGFSANQIKDLDEKAVFSVEQPEGSEFDSVLQINSDRIIPYITKAIQEMKNDYDKRIKDLEERVKQLEG